VAALGKVCFSVMPGLVPGIHGLGRKESKAWMAGSSPAMTTECYSLRALGGLLELLDHAVALEF
jgi:hypothetical protein